MADRELIAAILTAGMLPTMEIPQSRAQALCCTDQQSGEVSPRIHFHVRRTYSGRPSSSMRFSEATAMATSVVCRPSVRERSASPITRL